MIKSVVQIVLALSLLILPAMAQVYTGSLRPGVYSFGTITGVGTLGSVVGFTYSASSPSNHSLDYAIKGTPPKVCQYQLLGSLDGMAGHWASLSDALDCTGSPSATGQASQIFYWIYHIVDRPVPFVAIQVLAYTPGDSTTAVAVNYVRGQ